MNTDVSHLGGCAGACGCGGSCAKNGGGFNLDTPVMAAAGSSLPVVKSMGYVMGISGLSEMRPDAKAGPIISRVSNLAALTTAMLLKLPPQLRESTLTDIGGFNWANDVLRTVHNDPKKRDVTDGIRSALGFYFLVGIVDAESKKDTPNARAYLAFARLFKDAQDARNRRPAAPAGLGGLGSLGQAGSCPSDKERVSGKCVPKPNKGETAMWADHKYCEENKGKTFPVSELEKCKRCANPAGIIGSPRNSYNYAEWYGAYLCKRPAPYEEQGRRDRGMTHNFVPAVSYPAPPDKPSVDKNKIREWCGAGNKDERIQGVRELFKRVFNRYPNNTEVEYYASTKWCVNKAGGDAPTMRMMMDEVRTAIIDKRSSTTTPSVDSGIVAANAFGDRQNVVQAATQAAFDAVTNATGFIANVVCDGFKKIFGELIGGALCQVVTVLLTSFGALYQSMIVIVQEAFQGILDFIKELAAGRLQEAMLALLRAVGRMLFALSAPVSVPLLMGTGNMTPAQAFADLRTKADRVTKKNPLFPITLVIALMQLTAGPSVQVISGIVLSISPMVAVFVAPALLQNPTVKQVSGIASQDAMETAIENIIKLVVIVVQGLMSLQEIIPKLRGQLQAVVERKMGKGAAGVAEMVVNTIRALEAGFNALQSAIKKFQFQQVTSAAVTLLNTVPLMLAAFVGPEDMAAGAVPALSEWMSANEAAGRTVDQQEAALREASLTFLRRLPFPQAMLVAVDASMANNDLRERAKMVALIVGKTYKDNQSGFTGTFVPAFKAELLKVN